MDKLQLERLLDDAKDELIENKVVHDACMAFLRVHGIEIRQQRGFSYVIAPDSTKEYPTLEQAVTAALVMITKAE